MTHASPPRIILLLLIVSAALAAVMPPRAEAQGDPAWLQRWNEHRADAGLPPVAEDAARSDAIRLHAMYAVNNNHFGHDEDPSLPGYTPEGDEAARKSNLSYNYLGGAREQTIDGWMTAVFHQIGMLRPTLVEVGFGDHYDPGSSGITYNAGAWVIADPDVVAPTPAFPVIWPADGASIALLSFDGFEVPDPLTHCPGFSAPTGPPIHVQLDTIPADAIADLRLDDRTAVEHCVIVGPDYQNPDAGLRDLGRSLLQNSVVIFPRHPLDPDRDYAVQATIDGVTHDWTFDTFGRSGTGQPPPADAADDAGTPTAPPGRAPAVRVVSASAAETARHATASPIAAAVEVSELRFESGAARHVVLVRDDAFPDALAGSALLGDGPMLLTASERLPAATLDEIARVLGDDGVVYVLGGEVAVSAAVEQELGVGGYEVRRLAGPDRIQTSVAVAEEVALLYPEQAGNVLIARAFGQGSAGWADSVTAGGFAARYRIAVVLSDSAGLSDPVRPLVAGRGAFLLGGEAALSAQVAADAGSIAAVVNRIDGPARDATALAVLERLWGREPGVGPVLVINGYDESAWSTGLPAAGLSADLDAPMMPVTAEEVPPATAEALTSCGAKSIDTVVLGGPALVSEDVLGQVEALDGSC